MRCVRLAAAAAYLRTYPLRRGVGDDGAASCIRRIFMIFTPSRLPIYNEFAATGRARTIKS